MIISASAAVAENGVIGKDNTLVWKLSNDLKRFKEIKSFYASDNSRLYT